MLIVLWAQQLIDYAIFGTFDIMNLDQYISELLYRYECVIIPEFGALLTQRKSAYVLAHSNTFYPPSCKISFNRQLVVNDGLLANHIAQTDGISYSEALSRIQHTVAEIKILLEQRKKVRLAYIGDFYVAEEDTLQFEPLTDINYLTESFGLSDFVSGSITRQIISESQVVTSIESEPVSTQHVPLSPVPVSQSVQENAELEDDTKAVPLVTKRRLVPIYRYAAIGVLVLGLTGFVGLQYHRESVLAHNSNVRIEASQEAKNQIQTAGFAFKIEKPLPTVKLNVITPVVAAPQTYYIIAGAFRIRENAVKEVKELRRLGYEAVLLESNKYQLHQVAYTQHQNRREALKELWDIKRTHNEGAWLWIKK